MPEWAWVKEDNIITIYWCTATFGRFESEFGYTAGEACTAMKKLWDERNAVHDWEIKEREKRRIAVAGSDFWSWHGAQARLLESGYVKRVEK